MSLAAKRAEREMELQAALQLRLREIERLSNRKEELQSALNMSVPQGKQQIDIGVNYPATAYCGPHPARKLASIPLEQVQNILSQLRIAKKGIHSHNEAARHSIHEVEGRLMQSDAELARITSEIVALADMCGIPVPPLVDKSQKKGSRGASRQSAESTPARSVAVDRGASVSSSNAVVVADAKMTNAEIAKRNSLLMKEIRAAGVVLQKKNKTLVEMRATLAEKEELVESTNALANAIRCVDREIREQREEQKLLLGEQEEVDGALTARLNPSSPQSRSLAVLERDVDHINGLVAATVVNERRNQDRVVKAQDFRLQQLTQRLATIEKALASHKLTAEVDRVRLEAMGAEGMALQVMDDEEDLYDIELIIPAQEKVHPAIYSLFLAEKERLAKRVSVLNLVAKEKEESIDALTCKVDAQVGECSKALQDLDRIIAETSKKEEGQRQKAMAWVQDNRRYYDELLRERNSLRSVVKSRRRH